MRQSPLLQFESTAFVDAPGTDEETNPGIFGKALADWLSRQLEAQGSKPGDVIAEDFGWCVPLESNPHKLYVACPIIRFKEIAVPSAGKIQSAVGGVDRFTTQGWVPLRSGDVLEDGARFQLEAGASTQIRFSDNWVVELSPQQEARGFQVQVHAGK